MSRKYDIRHMVEQVVGAIGLLAVFWIIGEGIIYIYGL